MLCVQSPQIYCTVLYGEIKGKTQIKKGNFSKHMQTLKKAKRLGNYCICAVITYLLALTLILVEMRGVEPLSKSVAI